MFLGSLQILFPLNILVNEKNTLLNKWVKNESYDFTVHSGKTIRQEFVVHLGVHESVQSSGGPKKKALEWRLKFLSSLTLKKTVDQE